MYLRVHPFNPIVMRESYLELLAPSLTLTKANGVWRLRCCRTVLAQRNSQKQPLKLIGGNGSSR